MTAENLTTSIRNYSLIVLARQNVDEARAAWISASETYQRERTLGNAIAAASAYSKFEKAQADHEAAKAEYDRRNQERDGSDNTVGGSLRDAGFGDFGPY